MRTSVLTAGALCTLTVAAPMAAGSGAVATPAEPAAIGAVSGTVGSSMTNSVDVIALAQSSAIAPIASEMKSDSASTQAASLDTIAGRGGGPDISATKIHDGPIPPLKHFQLTARFGQPGSWASGHHTGLDFVASEGTPIYASETGVVRQAGEDEVEGTAYGKLIRIQHSRTTQTWYAHADEVFVTKGQHVTRGQMIGRVGSTGRAYGSHCHMEFRVKSKNPNEEGLDPYGYRAEDPAKFIWGDGPVPDKK